MIEGQGGLPILGRGGAPDPNQPTLHTCADCGFQLFIPAGVVHVAARYHSTACVGPKLADLAEQLKEIAGLIVRTSGGDIV